VYKFLKKISGQDARRILFVIEHLTEDPFFGDIKKMKGEENVWRRRVGSYRISYELVFAERVLHVFGVERRTSTTY
jgi:mRNA interferase RelE/StbE